MNIFIDDSGAIAFPDAEFALFGENGANTPWNGAGLQTPGWYDSTNQRTWIAYEAYFQSTRRIVCGYYDHSTDEWSEFYTVGTVPLTNDDHGSPSVFRDASGYIHVFFGAHNTTLKHSRSTSVDDNTAWTAESNIGSVYTYPIPVFDGATLYLFLRKDIPASTKKTLVLLESTSISSGTITFASEVTLADFGTDSRIYVGGTVLDGADIHISATKADWSDTERAGVYLFTYDTTDGSIDNYDGSTSTASGSLPIDLTLANSDYRLYDHGSNQGDIPAICQATDGKLHICFLDGTSTTYDINHLTITSGVLSSVGTAATSLTMNTAGIGFVDSIEVVALPDDMVELWYPKDQGGSFDFGGDMTRQVYAGSWQSPETILAAGSNALARPSKVVNGIENARLLFTEIKQSDLDSAAGLLKPYLVGTVAPADRDYDVYFSAVHLLIKSEPLADTSTSITDESLQNRTITVAGNAQIDTAQFPFGTNSILFDGSGDYLTTPAANQLRASNAGDKTYEAHVRVSSFGASLQTIMDMRGTTATNSSREFSFYIDTAGKLGFIAWNSSGAAVVNLLATNAISAGTWYHVAATRASGTWRIFLNGVVEASGAESASPGSNTSVFNIGRSGDTANVRYFNGWMKEIRMTNSVARYTANFTPPSTTFPRS